MLRTEAPSEATSSDATPRWFVVARETAPAARPLQWYTPSQPDEPHDTSTNALLAIEAGKTARAPGSDDESVVSLDESTDSDAGWEEDRSEMMDVPHMPKVKGRRLWSSSVIYPAGAKKWRDTANCTAALSFVCPCAIACLSRVPSAIDLYEHRRQLRVLVKSKGSGGLRDVLREELARHYDRGLRSFSQSFVVGDAGSICERAFAVACGVSEATYVRARADVTKDRPLHPGRACARASKQSEARRILNGWVCAQRNTMEGDKQSGQKWFTEKTTEPQLWARYVATCDKAQQPSVGTSQLLWTIWKEHKEIVQVPPSGHDQCDRCASFKSERMSLAGLEEPELLAALNAEEAAHHIFHTTEREYYDSAVTAATYQPDKVTTLTIDAPTRHQFDLPSQARAKRDTAKKLDGKNRWESKLEGVLDAGAVYSRCVHAARVRHARPAALSKL